MPTTFNASQTEVRQNSILAGLQLQLPLYIRAARQGLAGYEAAGGLYQPIRDVLVGSEDADQISTQIDKDLQTSGMILDEEAVQKAAKPVKISGRSDTNDTVSAVSAAEMAAVEDCAVSAAAEQVTQIYRGEVSPRPVRDGMESPCAWCDHPNACKHDSTIPGCRTIEIDHRRRTEILRDEPGGPD